MQMCGLLYRRAKGESYAHLDVWGTPSTEGLRWLSDAMDALAGSGFPGEAGVVWIAGLPQEGLTKQ